MNLNGFFSLIEVPVYTHRCASIPIKRKLYSVFQTSLMCLWLWKAHHILHKAGIRLGFCCRYAVNYHRVYVINLPIYPSVGSSNLKERGHLLVWLHIVFLVLPRFALSVLFVIFGISYVFSINTHKMLVIYIRSSECLRVSPFFVMQGLCALRLPISVLIIVEVHVLNFIIIVYN